MTRRRRPVEKRVAGSLFAALMIIVFGVFMVIAPWLPTYSPEQEDESPWFWVPLGLLFIAVGGWWLRRRVTRCGSNMKAPPSL